MFEMHLLLCIFLIECVASGLLFREQPDLTVSRYNECLGNHNGIVNVSLNDYGGLVIEPSTPRNLLLDGYDRIVSLCVNDESLPIGRSWYIFAKSPEDDIIIPVIRTAVRIGPVLMPM